MRNRISPFQGPRLLFFGATIFAAFILLVLRMYELQIVRYKEFDAFAAENAVQSVPLSAPRGTIYDRNGVGLALNSPAFNVSIVPALLPDDAEQSLQVLNRLSALIDVPATRASADAAGKQVRSLQELVKEGEGIAPYRAVIVKTDIPQNIAQEILEDKANLPGVDVGSPVAVRQYPSGATTAQIVGYLGPIGQEEADKLREQGYNPAFERVGYAGIEAYLDDILGGKRGLLTQVVDVAGLPVRVLKRDEPVAGQNVKLTIDTDLQKASQDALNAQINHLNSKEQRTVTQSGVVIAMNPKTGEILSLVSWPTYDNSRFARNIDAEYYLRLADPTLQHKPLFNNAISSLVPPGSVWKVLTSVAVAQEKVIDPNSFLYDNGELFVENKFAQNDPASRQRFVCWYRAGHKEVNLTKAIAWSCDVYFYQVGGGNPAVSPQTLKEGGLGPIDLVRYSTMFGIGTKLGIELPGENSGRIPDPEWKRRVYGESWSTGDTYNAAFGQGYVTVTPLQLLNAVASIANGGTLYQPTLVNSLVDSEGNELQPFTPKIHRTLVLPPTGTPAVILAREDMILKGKDSISCVCDRTSPYNDPTDKAYDPNQLSRCTDDFKNNYQSTLTLKANATQNRSQDVEVTYKVQIPYGYSFRNTCDPLIFDNEYQPPFVDPKNFSIVREGMREAVTDIGGTAIKGMASVAALSPAGKTGTAEYCDNIANKAGLCLPGAWPSHAWFVSFAPFDNPEIIIIAFVYNGGEGSGTALPIVRNVMKCYFEFKEERQQNGGKGPVKPCEMSVEADTRTDKSQP